MIEKHVTLDKTANGPDHKASIDIPEPTSLVSAVRHVEIALGSWTSVQREPAWDQSCCTEEPYHQALNEGWWHHHQGRFLLQAPGYRLPSYRAGSGHWSSSACDIEADRVIRKNSLTKMKIGFLTGAFWYGVMRQPSSAYPKTFFTPVIYATGMHFQQKYGLTINELKADNFAPIVEIPCYTEEQRGKKDDFWLLLTQFLQDFPSIVLTSGIS